jgi:uncharacterized protein (TIGR02145 family)
MARILFLMMFPFMCFSQITPSEDIPVNNLLKEKENLDTKRKASYNLDEIKVRWKKASLENCPGVPCVVTPPAPASACGSITTVLDGDGNSYQTVGIGTQCWMTSNLKVTKYNDGTVIGDSTNSTWGTAAIGARTENKEPGAPSSTSVSGYIGTFGYLYNWYAVNDPRKLCPDGWRVPSDSDWNKLVISLHSGTTVADTSSTSLFQSATAGTVLKSTVTNTTNPGVGLGWEPGSPGTNGSGFTALPGGYREFDGSFFNIRVNAFFWSATQFDINYAWYRYLYNTDGNVVRITSDKSVGGSVRCLRD